MSQVGVKEIVSALISPRCMLTTMQIRLLMSE
jgi:hypothetical protein